MKEIAKLGGILFLVTVVAAAALSGVNSITKPKIEEQRRLETERALTIALPNANPNAIIPIIRGDAVLFYRGYSETDSSDLVGYAIIARGKGYSSTIETMVGVDTSFVVTGLKILFQQETPGLGTKIGSIVHGDSTIWIQARFIGRPTEGLAVDKDGGNIKSIIGATISSRAITNSIVAAVDSLKNWVNRGL